MSKNFEVSCILNKPQRNEDIGDMLDDDCIDLIYNASVICLFGLSFGETDTFWWCKLKEHLEANNKLIILLFLYEKNDMLKSFGAITSAKKEAEKIEFLKKIGFPEDKINNYLDQIYVVINSDIFKLPKDRKLGKL